MNKKTMIAQIRDLGFSDDTEISDFGEAVTNAINLAVSTIVKDFPFYDYTDITVDDDDDGEIVVDMTEETGNFISFRETPVAYKAESATSFSIFTDYDIWHNTEVHIDAGYKGTFRIYYAAEPTRWTTGTKDNVQCDLPTKSHHLVVLLAAYHLWLDDEQVKAVYYYNEYETERQKLLSDLSNTVKMRVLEGGI